MRSWEAAALVNRTVFRPGWHFYANVYGPDHIDLRITIDTVNTSYPDPGDGSYDVPLTLDHPVTVDVAHLDEDGVLRQLISYAHQIDEHEDREMLRVRQENGTWYAPFHPHRDEGERRWNAATRARRYAGA